MTNTAVTHRELNGRGLHSKYSFLCSVVWSVLCDIIWKHSSSFWNLNRSDLRYSWMERYHRHCSLQYDIADVTDPIAALNCCFGKGCWSKTLENSNS